MGNTIISSPILGGTVVPLTDAANIAWPFSGVLAYSLTLEGDHILDNPTDLVAGMTLILQVTQGAGGSHSLSYGTAFKFPDASEPDLSTVEGYVDFLTFFTDGTTMYLIGEALGVAQPLAAPSGLTASTNLQAAVDLAWTNNAVGATNNVIQRQNDTFQWESVAVIAPDAVAYQDVVDAGVHIYRVLAKRDSLLSTPSNETEGEALHLAAPTGLTASTDLVQSVKLDWTNHAVGATEIVIQEDFGEGEWLDLFFIAPNLVTYTMPAAGTKTYRVTPFRDPVYGDPSNEVVGIALP